MISEQSDNPSRGDRPLRLLVLAERDARYAPGWPQAWEGADCIFAGELYGALVELAKGPGQFDGLVIDARRLTTPWVRAIGLIRKHVGLAVWLLDSAEGRPTVVAEAVALGATIAGHEPMASAEPPPDHTDPEDLATALLRLHSTPRAQSSQPTRAALPNVAAPATVPVGVDARGGRTVREFTESAQTPIESEQADNYHGVTLQPVLTEEELRALLGPEP